MSQVTAWRRCFDRWSSEETFELIQAWAPLYRRRREGTKDAWVPLRIRGHARSSRALVTEDWRAVASAVNSYRATTARRDSCRTHAQCKRRVETLKSQYMKGRARQFFSALHAVWADEVAGSEEARAAPVGDAGGPAAAGACGAAAADEGDSGSAAGSGVGVAAVDASGNERGIAMHASAAAAVEGFVAAGDPSHGSAVGVPGAVVTVGAAATGDAGGTASAEAKGFIAAAVGDASLGSAMEVSAVVIVGAPATGDAGGTTASVDASGGAFLHEDRRAAASSRTADGVKRALSDIYEDKHYAVGEERGGVEDASGGGASVDGRGAAAEAARRCATFVPPPIPKRPRSGKASASSTSTTADLPAEALAAHLTAVLPAEALAAGSADAVVMMKLAEEMTKLAGMYKELRMKKLDVEREKAAAAHAGAGRRA